MAVLQDGTTDNPAGTNTGKAQDLTLVHLSSFRLVLILQRGRDGHELAGSLQVHDDVVEPVLVDALDGANNDGLFPFVFSIRSDFVRFVLSEDFTRASRPA